MAVRLGQRVRDPVSGYVGVVVSRMERLNEPVKIGVLAGGPGPGRNANLDAVWFRESTLEILVPAQDPE